MANYENIRLEKDMYRFSNGLTGALEMLDSSENYRGTSLEYLDAFHRQLKRFDIKVTGPFSDVVDKFFQTPESAVLFPEYVMRVVRRGMEEANILPSIVASTTKIDSFDYRTITSVFIDENSPKEGIIIPRTEVKTQDNLVKLHKRGRMLVASYEAIRFQRLDVFAITLRQIGAYIARAHFKDAIDVLINGDGNNNAAEKMTSKLTNHILYEDLIKLWSDFSSYELNTIITSPIIAAEIFNIFRDKTTDFSFRSDGTLLAPLGAKLIKSADVNSQVIAFNKNYALEMVNAGDIETDINRLIDRQFEHVVISKTTGFAKIVADSVKVMTV